MRLLFFPLAFLLPCPDAASQQSGTVAIYDLVITEILADPDPPNYLPDAEYVEIFNRSQQVQSLDGWHLFDGTNRALPDISIDPGQYMIICANSDTILLSGY